MTLRLLRVVGARPQFVQAKPLSDELARRGHSETILHTGQHYDRALDRAMFDDLELRKPDLNLEVGSGTHAFQTAEIMIGVERHLLESSYDAVIVDGDTNSTVAAALAAAKLHVPVVHIESGMRSFDRRMPEEINRVLTDHVATVLAAPSATAERNLAAEGIAANVHLTGDVLAEAFHLFRERALAAVDATAAEFGLVPGSYLLLTMHRAENVDDPRQLAALVAELRESTLPLVWPMHPRTRGRLEAAGLAASVGRPPFHLVEAVGYLRMLALEAGSAGVLTDSGGVQREAYLWEKPSVILRATTEWPEIVDDGWARLALLDGVGVWPLPSPSTAPAAHYGGAGVSARIAAAVESLQ